MCIYVYIYIMHIYSYLYICIYLCLSFEHCTLTHIHAILAEVDSFLSHCDFIEPTVCGTHKRLYLLGLCVSE